MIMEFVWETFEKTGMLEAYMFYKEMEALDKIEEERFNVEAEVAIST